MELRRNCPSSVTIFSLLFPPPQERSFQSTLVLWLGLVDPWRRLGEVVVVKQHRNPEMLEKHFYLTLVFISRSGVLAA